MGWGDRDGAVVCVNCREYYYDDLAGECRYHPGSLLDREGTGEPGKGWAGDIWSCCGQRLVWLGDRAWVAGCIAGAHVMDTFEDVDPKDVRPADREAVDKALAARASKLAIEHHRRDWKSPNRVADARWRVRRFLAGRLSQRNWETEVAPDDVFVLERAEVAYLSKQACNRWYSEERRRFVASLVTDPELAERIRRAAGE